MYILLQESKGESVAICDYIFSYFIGIYGDGNIMLKRHAIGIRERNDLLSVQVVPIAPIVYGVVFDGKAVCISNVRDSRVLLVRNGR